MRNLSQLSNLCLILTLLIWASPSHAQKVNAYARVTLLDDSLLVLSHVDEDYDTFESGEQVLLIQVQDNTLGSTSNSSAFGGLGSIGSAGLFEVIGISEVREAGSVPDTLILETSPSISFNTGSHARLQIVTYPELGDGAYTTTDEVTAPEWDGNTGGVVAFRVNGTLSISHDIHVDEAGFRAGDHSVNASQPNDCDGSVYITSDDEMGEKGEGIYFRTNSGYRYGRGRMLNGGGGGVGHNGGGGGGANYTAGGMGGAGWNSGTGCDPSISGLGGLGLSGYISENRAFMGGGGGGAQENNNNGTEGGSGGGLIFIHADTLTTTGTCSLEISAAGESAGNAGNDGAGGGGGGGSIIFEVDHFDINSSCPLTIRADGGDGGDSVTGSVHSGGGGGGQGLIVFSGAQPTDNVIVQTLNGRGGCDNTNCDSRAEDGSGSDNIGILTGQPSLLADYAIRAVIKPRGNKLHLEWQLTGEPAQASYEVQKSRDRIQWQLLCDGVTLTNWLNTCEDHVQAGTWYYRVLAHPEPELTVASSHLVFEAAAAETLLIDLFPNPTAEQLHLKLTDDFVGEYRIYSSDGSLIEKQFTVNQGEVTVNVSDLLPGAYQLTLLTPYMRESHRFIKTQQ